MFVFGGGQQTAYQVRQAERFPSENSASLVRTPAAAGTTTWTFSTWLKRSSLGGQQTLFCGYQDGSNYEAIQLANGDYVDYILTAGGATQRERTTSAVYRDTAQWMHLVVSRNGASITVEVNGSAITSFSVDTGSASSTFINSNVSQYLGQRGGAVGYVNGYLAETVFVDGQVLTSSSFGLTDPVTGQWIPKRYAGTFGANGFRLDYANAAAPGTDVSGAGNDFTATGMTSADQMLDTPTQNFATLNALIPTSAQTGSVTLSAGNLGLTGNQCVACGTMAFRSGKWVWEVTIGTMGASAFAGIGIADADQSVLTTWGRGIVYFSSAQAAIDGGTATAFGSSYSAGDVIRVEVDVGGDAIEFFKNGVSQGTKALSSSAGGGTWMPIVRFTNTANNSSASFNFGQSSFVGTPTSGFNMLRSVNLPGSTIRKPGTYMVPVIYTGTGAAQSIANIGFDPDLVWIKNRGASGSHHLFDTVRGVGLVLFSDGSSAELNRSDTLTSFDANGFSLGTGASGNVNTSANAYVGWCWKKGATPGFDIVSYVGNGTARTISHGLGAKPDMIIVKDLSSAFNWELQHSALGSSKLLNLNSTSGASSAGSVWNSTSPDSSGFSIGIDTVVNTTGDTYVAYVFAGIEGFSKFGIYTGNGLSNGPFIWCGFRPIFVMIKRTDSAGDWKMHDRVRDPYNGLDHDLVANSSAAEGVTAGGAVDFVSNGFKLRNTSFNYNSSGGSYVFAAFAAAPFKNARAA